VETVAGVVGAGAGGGWAVLELAEVPPSDANLLWLPRGEKIKEEAKNLGKDDRVMIAG
jgi:hypothetical protein